MPLYVPLATSANIAALVSDETGSGSLVFGTAPQLSTIELGHASDTTVARAAAGAMTVEGRGVGVLLAHSAAPLTSTNTTNEEVTATIAVPAGAIGANGFAIVQAQWTYTNSANTKTMRVRFGASGSGTGGTALIAFAATTTATWTMQATISNRNATNSQVCSVPSSGATGGWHSTTSTFSTAAIDTTAATDIILTTQKATGTEVLTLERYAVWLFYKA